MRWFRKDKFETEMAEEMRHHVELQTELNRKAGMNAGDARHAALRQFGNLAVIQQQVREGRGWVWLEQLGGDLRHGLRAIRKSPGFAFVVIFTLALGIGINLAVLALFNAVLLQPLPGIRQAGELVVLGRVGSRPGNGFGNSSYPVYRDYRAAASPVFTELAAFAQAEFSLANDGNVTELVRGELVSGNYFQTLGVRLAAGRAFLPQEDEVAGRNPVAIISHRLWQGRWAGDPAVIGRTIHLNGHAFTIVGVAEPGFKALQLPTAHDVWVPLQMRGILTPSAMDPLTDPNSRWLRRIVGRLAPGVTLQQAQDHITALSRALQPPPPPGEPPAWSHRVVGYGPFPVPDKAGPYTLFSILIAIALLVLGAVTVNAAGLFLSRALSRRREAAVRLALGASRGRLVRQMVAEGLVLAALAAVIGVLASQFAAEWLVAQIPGENGDGAALDIVFNGPLAAASVGLAFLTAMVVGLLPAWQASRVDVLPALKFSEGAQSPRRSRLRSGLVVAQVALSVVLLICAGLVGRSLQKLEANDPSRRKDGLLLTRMDLRLNGYDNVRGREFLTQLLERVKGDAAVQRAALAGIAPFADGSLGLGPVHGGVLTADQAINCNVNFVSEAYFGSIGLPLLRGREFSAQDNASAPPVAVINRVLAERLWPTQDPLGQLLTIGEEATPRLVVGLVNEDPSLRTPNRPDEERPHYYVPVAQVPLTAVSLLVQTKGDPAALLATVRTAVRELDSNVPLFQITTLAAARDRTLWQQRLVSWLVLFCSGSAVVLAMVGLYAALAQDVARRTREIGIRVAIGAAGHDVLSLVLGQGLRLTLLGLGAGLAAAFGLTRLLQSVLAGVSATDLVTFILAPMAMLALAALACWVPARRATEVDPMVALRTE